MNDTVITIQLKKVKKLTLQAISLLPWSFLHKSLLVQSNLRFNVRRCHILDGASGSSSGGRVEGVGSGSVAGSGSSAGIVVGSGLGSGSGSGNDVGSGLCSGGV